MQMASGSIFDKLLELVDSVTPTEAVTEITFNLGSNPEGAYFVLSDPPGSPTIAQAQSAQTQILTAQCFFVTGKSSPSSRNSYTLSARQTPIQNSDYDYWGTGCTISNGTMTIKINTNMALKYLPGYTYYLFKSKVS